MKTDYMRAIGGQSVCTGRTTLMLRALRLAWPTAQTLTQIMHALILYYNVLKKYMWVHEQRTGEAPHRLARAGELFV